MPSDLLFSPTIQLMAMVVDHVSLFALVADGLFAWLVFGMQLQIYWLTALMNGMTPIFHFSGYRFILSTCTTAV